MLHELNLILVQFGGGSGDPANNAVRFLLATFFWGVLLVVSSRTWQRTKDRKHLYFALAAAVGINRELVMFVAEYGSFRGYVSFPAVFRYYPPYEHAVTMLSVIFIGYAALRFYANLDRFSRLYLIGSTLLTITLYLVIAPQWIRYLDSAAQSSANNLYVGAQFHEFAGDLAFRISAVLIYAILLGAFFYARTRQNRIPLLAALAFLYFFLDDALQIVLIFVPDKYSAILAPLRHCLHLWGITLLVGVYWWDIERRLGELQDVRNKIFNLTPNILGIADLSGKISIISPASYTILGYRPNELVGANMQDFGLPNPVEMTLKMAPPRLISEEECIYHLLDGTERWIHWKFQVVKEQKQIYFVISDITDRKFAEFEREEMTFKLAESNKELEHFAYIASHDLQEPLRTITSFIQLLAKRYQGKLDKDADEFIGFVTDGAQRMQRLINDLLAYSRVKTKGKPFAPFDCGVVIEHTLANLRQAIEESGATITHDPLPNMFGDEMQMVQLFQNLIGNAIKFRGSTPPLIRIGIVDNKEEWGVSISDNGIGIEPKFFDRIFEIFQRLHSREQYSGTGIGLAVCKKIVERHGGTIGVDSEPGQGTNFIFTISKGLQTSTSEL